MTKYFNAEQMAKLKRYEKNFSTAVHARWSSFLTQNSLNEINGIWNELTGQTRALRGGCSACMLELLIDAGTIYFATIEHNKESKVQTSPKAPVKKKSKK